MCILNSASEFLLPHYALTYDKNLIPSVHSYLKLLLLHRFLLNLLIYLENSLTMEICRLNDIDFGVQLRKSRKSWLLFYSQVSVSMELLIGLLDLLRSSLCIIDLNRAILLQNFSFFELLR